MPEQYVYKLPYEAAVGPRREGPSYRGVAKKLEYLEGTGSLLDTQEELQEEINECYGRWRRLAVDEACAAADCDTSDLGRALKETVGNKVKVKWRDPRAKVRAGRKQLPTWSGACGWLQGNLNEIGGLMRSLEETMEHVWDLDQKEITKMNRRAEQLEGRLRGFTKLKRKQTPFPKSDPGQGKMNDIFDRAQVFCAGVLQAWQLSSWLLGMRLWQAMQTLANEAGAHGETNERGTKNKEREIRRLG